MVLDLDTAEETGEVVFVAPVHAAIELVAPIATAVFIKSLLLVIFFPVIKFII